MKEVQLTLLSEEALAKPSQLPDSEKDLKTQEETWLSLISDSLTTYVQNGLFGKMSPVSCHRTEDGTLEPSLGRWQSCGMGGHTEFLTLSTTEYHSVVVGSTLSDILLEIGDVEPKYYLSQRACKGILRRAEQRGRTLPPLLKEALLAVIDNEEPETEA